MLRFTKHIQIVIAIVFVFCLLFPRTARLEEPGDGRNTASSEKDMRIKKETAEILVEKGGVLMPKGRWNIEPSIEYTYFSRNQIAISGYTILEAIAIGTIQVEEIKRDIITGALTARYGLTDRLQLDAKIPYLYRHDRLDHPAGTSSQPNERVVDDSGLGDIEGAVSYHAWLGKDWQPDVIVRLSGKSTTGRDPYGLKTETVNGQTVYKELPTGTGHWSLSGGLTFVKASDPVVFFVTTNYYWNIKRNVGHGLGTVDPGDSFEYDLGMATALNEKISLSLSFQNLITSGTTQNSHKVPGSNSNVANTFLGASFRVSEKTALFASVGVGLTEDSPDFSLKINLPIYF